MTPREAYEQGLGEVRARRILRLTGEPVSRVSLDWLRKRVGVAD